MFGSAHTPTHSRGRSAMAPMRCSYRLSAAVAVLLLVGNAVAQVAVHPTIVGEYDSPHPSRRMTINLQRQQADKLPLGRFGRSSCFASSHRRISIWLNLRIPCDHPPKMKGSFDCRCHKHNCAHTHGTLTVVASTAHRHFLVRTNGFKHDITNGYIVRRIRSG